MSEHAKTKTIRLYADADARGRVEGQDAEVGAHGWDYAVGDSIEIDGAAHVLTRVSSTIHTGDVRGNYVYAEAVSAEEVRS